MDYFIKKIILTILASFGLWLYPSAQAYDYSLLPGTNGIPEDYFERRAGGDVNASVRIGVTVEGLYRLTYAGLTNAGISAASLIGAEMRVFCRTQEVAIWVSNSNQWNSTNDYLLFPGVGFDGYYTTTNVYWLGFGPGGKRMAQRSAISVSGASLVTSHRQTVLHHADAFFWDSYRASDVSLDHWSDIPGIVYAAPVLFTMVTDRVVTSDPATFQAVMLGYTATNALVPDHTTRVGVNTTTIGQFPYTGMVTAPLATNFFSTLLQETNSISLQQIIYLYDQALLERFSITYSRTLYQNNGGLYFDGRQGTNNYRVTGFSASNNLMVLDVTDPANALLLTGAQPTNMEEGLFAQQYSDASSRTSRYCVCSPAGIKEVGFIQKTYFRSLVSTHQRADYLVICPYNFRQQVYRLLTLRYAQGLSVAIAPLPDIYNEFSYGIADAGAIKQFIGYAFHHWVSPPKYVLLVGGGTYDPLRHESASPYTDLIPVHLGPGNGLWTSLDGWYAAVNGPDAAPDVALGRIPVDTANELKTFTDKMVAFEGLPTNYLGRTQALMISDSDDLPFYDFSGAADALASNRLDPVGINTLSIYGEDLQARTKIVQAINSNKFLINYFGHGNLEMWSAIPLLKTNDVIGLTNTLYPIISMITCLNGSFHSTKSRCLAEYFLVYTNHGASACVAASGLASLNAGEPFMNGLYGALLGERRRRIGDALLPAYLAMSTELGVNVTELQFFELFGDPAMIVNP